MGRFSSNPAPEPPAYEGASGSHAPVQAAPVQQQYPPAQHAPQQQFHQQPPPMQQQYSHNGPMPPQSYQNAGLGHLQGYSAVATCPRCHQTSPTKTRPKTGSITHLWALGLCFLTLLCCIPYCVSSCKDSEHFCGHCNTPLAVYHKASGNTQVLAH